MPDGIHWEAWRARETEYERTPYATGTKTLQTVNYWNPDSPLGSFSFELLPTLYRWKPLTQN
jgi:hypothetical protein